jgi:hypothetical protein
MDSAVVPQGSERHTCRCHRSCSADCLLPIDLPDARKYPPKFPTELSIARFLRRLRVCERYSPGAFAPLVCHANYAKHA